MVDVINQPWNGPRERVGDVLQRELAGHGRYNSLTVVVAFAKQGGVTALRNEIQRFLAAGNGVEAFVGVDALGTSREALQLLLDIGVTVHVFHNPGSTFHPKLYLLEGDQHAFAVVGSSNLTTGGLFTNYEVGIRLPLHLADEADLAAYAQLRAVIDTLRVSPNTKDLTPELLEELTARGMLGSESAEESDAEADVERRRRRQPGVPVFPRTPVPPPPRTPAPSAGVRPPGVQEPVAGLTQFVMILGPRDTRTQPGYSPDIFIPLAARNAEPRFWRWPQTYVRVAARGSYDERRVNVLVHTPAGATLAEAVRLYYYHERSEFRLNCGDLVEQARDGDLLVLELPADWAPNIDYVGTIIPQTSPAFSGYYAIALNRVANSPKRWGYA